MEHIASLLWDARQTGFSVPKEELSEVETVDLAYKVQERQLSYGGAKIGGWKLGATAQASLDVVGLDEPFMGPIPLDDIYESGATIPVFAAHSYFAETEIVIEIGGRLPPKSDPFTIEEAAAAIASLRVSIEIVGLRVEGGPKGLGPLIIADGAGHRATVLGPKIYPADISPDWPVSLSVDGTDPVSGGTDNLIWGSFEAALAYVADRQSSLARRLQVGDILMTGTMTGMTPISPESSIRAQFGDHVVSANLTEA